MVLLPKEESPIAQRMRLARRMQLEYKKRLAKRLHGLDYRDDDRYSAPSPLVKSDDDLPPPAGAAEPIKSKRKRNRSSN